MEKKSDILEELEALSPLLQELKSNLRQPFVVPDDYFATSKSQLFSAIEIGFAENLGKSTFVVPDNYFDHLSTDILAAIETETFENTVVEQSTPRVIELNSNRKSRSVKSIRIYAMAAAIAAIFLFMNYLNNHINDSSSSSITASNSNDALNYIEDNFEYFNSDELYALVDLTEESINLDGSEGNQGDFEQYLEDYIDDFDEYLFTNDI